jgi:predicted nucleotidyltransferase
MTRLLESKRDAITEVCARYGVRRLHAFGSALGEDFRSDESDLFNREIDLAMVGAIKNPYIARDIERTKQLLYAA